MINIMITFGVLAYSLVLLAIICGYVVLCNCLEHVKKNVRALPEELAAICKSYKYLN